MEHTAIQQLVQGFKTPMAPQSFFITLEGIEGAGKSTQIAALKSYWESFDYRVITLREPGATPFGEKLREAILSSDTQLHPLAELHLFLSARAQLLSQIILPALAQAKTVILCDRYMDSSLAYQGHARGLGLEVVLKHHLHEPLNTLPHLTFYLHIDHLKSQERQQQRNNQKDYFETEDAKFTANLIAGFEKVQKLFPKRIIKVDGSQESAQVTTAILANCDQLRSQYAT